MYAASVRSYLSVRDNAKSGEFDLAFGVQQGYYLGPLSFSIYASELFTIVSNHIPATIHRLGGRYAVLSCFQTRWPSWSRWCHSRNGSLCKGYTWMIRDKLMIKDDKTEFMLINTKVSAVTEIIHWKFDIGNSKIIRSKDAIKNLGNVISMFTDTIFCKV